MAPLVCSPIQSALVLGAHRVIAIDHHPHRLELAKSLGAEVINFEEVNVREALVEMTGGIGPDACIDAVGMESHGFRHRQRARSGQGRRALWQRIDRTLCAR